jgi:hypothetical protein
MKLFSKIIFLSGLISLSSFAVERPGGLSRTAVNAPSGEYEVLLSPAYTIAPGGAYLTSEMRYQMNEDFSFGAGFGAGEIGFNVGGNGIWYISPDAASQPAIALLGGLYFNRVSNDNYFLVKLTPIVSKDFKTGFGKVTPYAGMHLTPSFRLNQALNQVSLKATTGLEFNVASMSGIKLWSEFGVGIVNSNHEVVFGLSYPFAAL